MIFFVVHLLSMYSLYHWFLARRTDWSIDTRLLGGLVVTWSSTILASSLLASITQLSSNRLFSGLSLTCQVLLSWALAPRARIEAPARMNAASMFLKLSRTLSTWPRRLAAISLVTVGGMVFLMSLRTTLQIPDTLAMKLPNAYFYLKNGSLVPPVHLADEGRLFSTPFSGTLWWIYLIRFNQHLRTITVFNFIAWLAMFASCLRLSRLFGSSRWAATSAAALFCMTQNLLFQASSDNDDLLSSITGTIGAVFVMMWIRSKRRNELVIGALALGISTGAKFFPVLYLPAAALFTLYYLHDFWKKGRYAEIKKLAGQCTLAGAVVAASCAPYAYIRIFKAQLLQSEMLNIGANAPFRWSLAYFNTLVYNLQLFISPLTDAFFPHSGSERTRLVKRLNDFWVDEILPQVDKYWAYMPGVKIAHPDLYDNTVWFGILAWMTLAALLLTLFRKRLRFTPPFWLAIFFVSWDLFFCFRTKYIEELGRYWILPVSLVMPLVALLIDELEERSTNRKALSVVMPVVWASTIVCGFIGLRDNPIRLSFSGLTHQSARPPTFPAELQRILSSCADINFYRTIYGYPIYFHLMEFRGERVTYLDKIDPKRVNVIPALDLPVMAPFYERKFIEVDLGEDRGGVKFLGPSAIGIPIYVWSPETCPCQSACPHANSLVLFEVTPLLNLAGPDIRAEIKIAGVPPDDRFVFRISARMEDDSKKPLTDWTQEKLFYVDIPRATKEVTAEIGRPESVGDRAGTRLVKFLHSKSRPMR